MTERTPEEKIEHLRAECMRSKKYSPTFYCTVWCQVHHGPDAECALLKERIAALRTPPEETR